MVGRHISCLPSNPRFIYFIYNSYSATMNFLIRNVIISTGIDLPQGRKLFYDAI